MNTHKALARRRRDDYDDDEPRRRGRSDSGGGLSVVIGSVVMGLLLVLGVCICIGAIVAIRIREAARQVNIAVQAGKQDFNPPGGPPPINIPPVGKPPVNQPPANKLPVNIDPDGFARTSVAGGAFDPQFEDRAPPGGVLVGLELGVVNNDCIKSIRPIYLVNGIEVKGKQFGIVNPNVTLKAKQGYAVSALNVNAGLWIDGMSLTFARLKNGKLDNKDRYQSDYFGGDGGGRSVHGDNGMNIVGIICKSGNNECNGIGAILKQ